MGWTKTISSWFGLRKFFLELYRVSGQSLISKNFGALGFNHQWEEFSKKKKEKRKKKELDTFELIYFLFISNL